LGIPIVYLESKKRVVSVLDPLPIPTPGKNVLKTIVNNLNLTLQAANPTFKYDIFKWGLRVPVVPTNSYGYESCQSVHYNLD